MWPGSELIFFNQSVFLWRLFALSAVRSERVVSAGWQLTMCSRPHR